MRHLALVLAASSLALSGCGQKETTDNTGAQDQTLTAEDFETSDATAIDAATGADANMAADVDFNALENAADDDGNGRASTGTARPRPPANQAASSTSDSNDAAPEPAEINAE